MRATYDQLSDALTIVLADSEVEETKNIAPGVEVDYDSTGRVIAIELLHASDKYDVGHNAFEALDPYLSLAEAGGVGRNQPDDIEAPDSARSTHRHQDRAKLGRPPSRSVQVRNGEKHKGDNITASPRRETVNGFLDTRPVLLAAC